MSESFALPDHIVEYLHQTAHSAGYTVAAYLEFVLHAPNRPLNDVAERLPDLICVVDENGYFAYVNAAWTRALGYERAELAGQPFINFVHPDDHDRTLAEFSRIISAGHHALDFENRYRTRSGDYRWISWTSSTLEADGTIYAIARDVTESKRRAATLQADHQQSIIILESITDGFFALDGEWRFTYVNQQAERLLQRKRDDLIGQNVWGQFPEAQELAFSPHYEKAMRERVATTFTEYYPPLSAWFEVNAYPTGDGITVYFRDVTESVGLERALQQMVDTLEDSVKKRTEELQRVNDELQLQILERERVEMALREKEELFDLLTEHTSDLICLHAPDGTYIYVSPSCRDLLGYAPAEMIGRNPYEFFHPEDQQRIRKGSHTQALNGHAVASVTYQMRRKDGDYVWFETYTQPVQDADGQVQQLVTATRDITQAKTLENELLDALEKERELNELKSRIVSMVSHEFRTPLATIRSSSDLLRRYFERMTREQRQNHITNILGHVTQLTDLLNMMLEVNRANTVGLQFEPEPVEIVPFCERLLDELRPLAEPSHQLIFEADADCGTVDLDERLMRQILNNLISNAIKYSPQSQSVWLVTACDAAENKLILQVRDEGIGIPANELERIFEEFHRATNVGKIEGTGLGLSLVYQAVRAHNGSIDVASVQGQGTTFTLAFPLHQPAYSQA